MGHILEETIVDYLLGNISGEKRKHLDEHLNSCAICRNELESWNLVMNENKEIKPSESLNKRIVESIGSEPFQKERKRNQKILYLVSSAAAILIFCIGLLQLNQQKPVADGINNEFITTEEEHIPDQLFMNSPDTNRLNIIPVTMDRNVKGNVWLNEVTNEMILQVDGLKPLKAQDYQVWIVHDNHAWSDELLRVKDGKVQVYYKAPDVKTIRFIKVSVEPVGGSQLPTGPETLFIDLNQ